MLNPIPHGEVPIVLGIVAATMLEILRVLSAWTYDVTRLHKLKVDSHTLRLRLKKQSAMRIVEEERHRATFSNPTLAA